MDKSASYQPPTQEISGLPIPKQRLSNKIPPHLFALVSITSVQLGASISEGLFHDIGPLGTTFLRLSLAAVFFLLICRPSFHGYNRQQILTVLAFGITVVIMNGAFYVAIARIPLGIAVTLEFVGPLGVSLLQSRRLKDLIWVVVAAAGIVLLAPIGDHSTIDPIGIILALLAGIFWGIYILLNVQIGSRFTGGTGLSLSMLIAAILSAPMGIIDGGTHLIVPHTLLIGVGVALLSTVIPFSLELEALRRLPSRVFGILMSIEPAMATLLGFLILKQTIDLREILAIVLIIAASIGVALERKNIPVLEV
jgi:inner membrane transporter RhtA